MSVAGVRVVEFGTNATRVQSRLGGQTHRHTDDQHEIPSLLAKRHGEGNKSADRVQLTKSRTEQQ